MGLYGMTDGTLSEVASTSFQAEGVLERTHLQAALVNQISLVGPDLLVVAEEFGEFSEPTGESTCCVSIMMPTSSWWSSSERPAAHSLPT